MRNLITLPRLPIPAAMLTMLVTTTPALAQQHAGHDMAMPTSGVRAELIADLEQLETKYVALAQAMTGKYGWRPTEGVRSAGEVFMHVAAANFMIPNSVDVQPPEMFRRETPQAMMAELQALEKLTDEAKMRETLQHSFMHAKHAIARTPDDQLDGMVKLFGRDMTKRAVLTLLVAHMHEHLGQSIAYARTNGVTPPWSGGD